MVTEHIDRGPGYWKFNNNLSENEGFRSKLEIMIEETIANKDFKDIDPAQKSEFLKYQMVTFSREQAKYVAKSKKKELIDLD